MNKLLFDARWEGAHGIGRFTAELHTRLRPEVVLRDGDPLAPFDPLYLSARIRFERPGVFFSPGFNPPLFSPVPFVFTIHDLIHLDVPEESGRAKRLYYDLIVRPAARRAFRVLTVSEYSRRRLLEWTGLPDERVVVVGCGVSPEFAPEGPKHAPGYPYMLCVANRKPHRNLPRLLEAFACVDAPDLRLVLTGDPDAETRHLALRLGILDRVVFAGRVPEADLPALYRGALLLACPSLYEGFGLPPLEAMASGVPVLVSKATSLPEVVGDAAVLADPLSVSELADGLVRLVHDEVLRQDLAARGLERARRFTWDGVADRVRAVLNAAGR